MEQAPARLVHDLVRSDHSPFRQMPCISAVARAGGRVAHLHAGPDHVGGGSRQEIKVCGDEGVGRRQLEIRASLRCAPLLQQAMRDASAEVVKLKPGLMGLPRTLHGKRSVTGWPATAPPQQTTKAPACRGQAGVSARQVGTHAGTRRVTQVTPVATDSNAADPES